MSAPLPGQLSDIRNNLSEGLIVISFMFNRIRKKSIYSMELWLRRILHSKVLIILSAPTWERSRVKL